MVSNNITVSVDCVGCDGGLDVVKNGIKMFVDSFGKGVSIILHASEDYFNSLCDFSQDIENIIDVKKSLPAVVAQEMSMQVIKSLEGTSMSNALLDVKHKNADCMVSPGNTAFFMVSAKKIFGTMSGVKRPAIVAHFPNKNGHMAVLDLGANLECTSEVLLQFAIMGSIYSFQQLGCKNIPKVALLNVGSEAAKGTANLRQAYDMLYQADCRDIMEFIGFIEPNALVKADVDVVVSDGLLGNIMLKTAEGHAGKILSAFKKAYVQSGEKIAWFEQVFAEQMMHYRPCAGMLLGLNGVAVKSHGGASAEEFCNAINGAVTAVRCDIVQRIQKSINALPVLC